LKQYSGPRGFAPVFSEREIASQYLKKWAKPDNKIEHNPSTHRPIVGPGYPIVLNPARFKMARMSKSAKPC
jgi:hypothetical protein